MARNAPSVRALIVGILILLASPALAIQPSEKLLPGSTKGYLSSPNIEELRKKFRETQLGAMVQDEAMQPFIADLREQLRDKLNSAGARLGLTWDDLEGVPAGEVAIAAIQPDAKNKDSHATAIVVDITGKQDQADALLAKIATNLAEQKAVKSAAKAGAIELTVYTLPERTVERQVGREKVLVKITDVVVHFIHDNQLIVADNQAIATAIAGRFATEASDTLANVPAFKEVFARLAAKQENLNPQVRWFIDPFGYAEVSRAMAGGKRRRGTDLLNVLRKQDFTAIQGVGGHIFFSTGDEEVLHRTFVYAPPTNADKKQKWNLAMRMLDFPNSNDLAPPAWVPQGVCTYVTFHNKLQNSFWYAETLVDEYMGDKGVFKEIIENLRFDPAGPQLNLKKELIDHLGERVVIVSDVTVPVDVKSERLIVGIAITNPTVIAKTLEKNFSIDPKARKREVGDHVVWEVINEESVEPSELTIEGDDMAFVAAKAQEAEEEEAQPALPNMAFTVFDNHLMVATHFEFLEQVMTGATGNQPMDQLAEFGQVQEALVRLGAGTDSLRAYTRTDESYRGTYDLLRQGKLPQGETILARVLNNALGSGKKDEVRKQEIDGSKLPAFEDVQKYLGPAGSYLHTEDDGWILVGCLLKKQAK